MHGCIIGPIEQLKAGNAALQTTPVHGRTQSHRMLGVDLGVRLQARSLPNHVHDPGCTDRCSHKHHTCDLARRRSEPVHPLVRDGGLARPPWLGVPRETQLEADPLQWLHHLGTKLGAVTLEISVLQRKGDRIVRARQGDGRGGDLRSLGGVVWGGVEQWVLLGACNRLGNERRMRILAYPATSLRSFAVRQLQFKLLRCSQ